MKIVIAGGSGFIGKKLTDLLLSEDHEVVILTRKEGNSSKGISNVLWLKEGASPRKGIRKCGCLY